MRILVLGADGMLGHELVASLRGRHHVAGTVRQTADAYKPFAGYLPDTLFDSIDIRDFRRVEKVFSKFAPEGVINAVGIVKQRQEARDAIDSIEVNALFPHRLAEICTRHDVRLIHLSTDCVFSGRQGSYADDALHDAQDLYGRSKSMGEVDGPGIVTLRTSIIGLELIRKTSLIEWFLAQSGQVRGFTQAIYSGFTTMEMARIIEMLLCRTKPVSGIYNVSSEPITKFSLLRELNRLLERPVDVIHDASFQCDRSLDSSRFRSTFGYEPPSWSRMLEELVAEIRCREGAGV